MARPYGVSSHPSPEHLQPFIEMNQQSPRFVCPKTGPSVSLGALAFEESLVLGLWVLEWFPSLQVACEFSKA